MTLEHRGNDFVIKNCGQQEEVRLRQTCSACPEQYELYLGKQQIGYFRLRHGFFTVDYPDFMGTEIYAAEPNGDGIFDDDERENYLLAGVNACLGEHFSRRS